MVAYLTGGTSLGVFPGTASFPFEDREADNTTETGNNKYFLSPDKNHRITFTFCIFSNLSGDELFYFPQKRFNVETISTNEYKRKEYSLQQSL